MQLRVIHFRTEAVLDGLLVPADPVFLISLHCLTCAARVFPSCKGPDPEPNLGVLL
jgi:hypothetical protein